MSPRMVYNRLRNRELDNRGVEIRETFFDWARLNPDDKLSHGRYVVWVLSMGRDMSGHTFGSQVTLDNAQLYAHSMAYLDVVVRHMNAEAQAKLRWPREARYRLFPALT